MSSLMRKRPQAHTKNTKTQVSSEWTFKHVLFVLENYLGTAF